MHSTTAFTLVEKAGIQGGLGWEPRSLYSRYLEPHLRRPWPFRHFKSAVHKARCQSISRGKLEYTSRFTEEFTGKLLQTAREHGV